MTEKWKIKSPPHTKNNPIKNFPNFSDFIDFLDANEEIWVVYHSYSVRQSGHQKASDCNKKYKPHYEFTSRYDSDLKKVTVYGKKRKMHLES